MQPQTLPGNQMPHRSEKIILYTILCVNILMFIFSLVFSRGRINFSLHPFLFLSPFPDALEFLGATGTVIISKYNTGWSLITANWLHGGLLHLVFNMMALYTLIPLTIKEYGPFRMFAVYTLSGMAGFFVSYAGQVGFTIGASSGICGLIGACLYFGITRKGEWGKLVFRQTSGWVISILIIGFLVPLVSDVGVNNWGHGGGLVSGFILGWAFSYNTQRAENLFDKIAGIGLAAMTLWLLSRSVIKGVSLIFS